MATYFRWWYKAGVMDISAELAYMYGLERFGIKPGLTVMRAMMAALGHPERQFKTIHVAGTNGKGSTCAFLQSVLSRDLYRTGMYTSPHLVRFEERIRINEELISEADLARLVQHIRAVCDQAGIQPTFFEFTTALAFVYFAEQKIDVAVVEVGLGGGLDATNVVVPIVSVITNIGHDHMDILGNDVRDIAREKAGIIKHGVPVVTAEKNPNILAYFRHVCEARETQLHVLGEDLRVVKRVSKNPLPAAFSHEPGKNTPGKGSRTLSKLAGDLNGQRLSVQGMFAGELAIGMLGDHQLDNAGLALLALQVVKERGFDIPDSAVAGGLAAAFWPGRLEIVSREPLIIIDGAHNAEGVTALDVFLQQNNLLAGDVLLLAMKKGKDLPGIIDTIVPRFRQVVVTEGTFEPMPARELAARVSQTCAFVEAIPDTAEATRRARQLVRPGGFMLVTGSLYMIGSARHSLRQQSVSNN